MSVSQTSPPVWLVSLVHVSVILGIWHMWRHTQGLQTATASQCSVVRSLYKVMYPPLCLCCKDLIAYRPSNDELVCY